MKKIISMCLIIAMLLSCLPIGTYAVSDGSSSATIRVDSTTAFPGSTVTINVNIENNPGIIGATLKVEYGPYLTLTEAKNNGVLSTLTMQQSIFSDYANFLWFGATIADDNIQDGVVLELTFEVDADAPLGYQNIEVSYTDGDIDDKNLNSVTLEIENGSVAIIDYLPGDVSGDFKVTPWDLTLLSQYIVDECEYREDGYKVTLNDLAGDVNDSGTLNPRDLILISQYIVDECEYREDSYAVTLLPSSVRTSHTLEAIAAVDATCTENGNIAYWHCTDCDLYFSDANGTTEIDLSDTVVEATGHIAVIDEAVVPTYTTTGLTQGSHCSVCGQVLVAQEEIPVLAKDEYAISYYLYDGDSYLAEIGVTNPNPDVYTSEDGLALEEPTAVGYTFSGWSYGDNADPKKNFVIEAGETGAKKVYAHWTKDTYTVTFKSDMVPQATIENCTSDKAVYLSSLKLDKYTFIGWSDKEGNILTEIPKGNTEDVVLYANWSSNRNQAIPVSTLADPIISEMPDEGIILFTYEIGEIKNVPLYTTLQLNCVNGLISTTEITYVDEISEENAEAVAETIANATTNSASWTLSSDWSQTTEVSESYLNQTGMTREEAESVAVNETNSYNLISSFGDSSSYVDTTSGSYTLSLNEAHSTTDTTETGQDFELSVDAQYSPETEVSFGLFDIFDVSQTYSYEIGGGIDYSNYKHTTTSGTDSYSGSLSLSGADSQTSTDTKTWNTETGYSSSQSISSEQTVSNTISSLISEEYGYGEAYSEGGSNSEAQELASSNSKSNEYSSTLTYYTSKITTTTTSFTSTGETTGDYRMVKAGTVHVFSTVGYDVANKEYFVYTYNVLDDTTTEYLDYSYDGTFNDYETSIIPFEVPAFVNDYVNGRIASTNGLQINTSTGIITGYYPTGSESAEIINIPSYVSVENYDGTYSSVKVTGIAPGLFENNTDIVGVTLGEYITEVPASAFAGCTSLEYIICSAVTSFGDNAFAGCTSLAEFTIPSDIISVGKDAFLGVDSISAVASSATVAQEIAASGANNVVLDISEIPDSDSSNMSLEVGAISSFELWGKDKTYTNLSMSSAAETTVLTGVYVVDGTGVTFDLSSSNVTLNRVTVSSSGYAMLLSAENTSIILNGIVQMSSLSGNTVICKNIQLQTLTISYFSQMAVLEKLLICGEISGQTYLLCDDIEYIDTQTYEDYLKGMYSVTLNANGGTVSEELITAYYGSAIGNLPTPTLDYYTFEGWFTAEDGGDSVTSASTFTNDTVLYAHWTLNAESGWVLSSAVPSDAQVVDTKWSYDLTTTTESTATSLSGYTQYGSYWSQSGSGSRYYATFPSGFDTSNTIYKTFSSSAYSASETSTAKRTVSNSSAGYVYWHWMYDCGSSTAGDRAILSYKGTGPDNGYYYDNFGAFTSSTSYTSTGGAYYCNSISGLVTYYNTGRTTYADSQGSKYWFRFSYSKSSYTDYEKIFQYTKTESKESSTEISASSTISNVQKWVTYRTI